jgi:hypothetical protein
MKVKDKEGTEERKSNIKHILPIIAVLSLAGQ